MNMNKINSAILFLSVAFIMCFSTEKALSQDNDEIDFTSFKTYAFPSIQVNDKKTIGI